MVSKSLDPDLARGPADAADIAAAVARGAERAGRGMDLRAAQVPLPAPGRNSPRRLREDSHRDPARSRSIRAESVVSFIAAVLLHALLLYGLWLATPFHPAAPAEESPPVSVSLIADAPPALAGAIPTPEPFAPPPAVPRTSIPAPEPPPASAQEILPAPEAAAQGPSIETPALAIRTAHLAAEAATVPAQPRPAPRHPGQKHSPAHPSAAGIAASLAGTASHAAANGPPSSRASYLSNPKPDYPAEARRLREEGVVVISVEIGADGRASDATLKRSSGFPLLDEAAVEAVRRWTFVPARAGGVAVASRVDVPVRFSLSR